VRDAHRTPSGAVDASETVPAESSLPGESSGAVHSGARKLFRERAPRPKTGRSKADSHLERDERRLERGGECLTRSETHAAPAHAAAGGSAASAGAVTGSISRNRAPPCALGTKTRSPPCSRAMLRDTLSPSPVPFPGAFVVKNGESIFSKMAEGIPRPESVTETCQLLCFSVIEILIHGSTESSIASAALFSKFKRT
jgi:hypothetical protein